MNIISLQAILALVMFLGTLLAGLLPIKLLNIINRKRNEENERQNKLAEWILSLLSCFAGGVFMGTCFLDIFPHINENYERFILKSKWKIEYPLPQFFVCCGFFLVYLLEELILKIFSSSTLHSGHSHSVGNVSSLNNSTTTHHHKHRRDKTQCNEEHLKTSNTCTNNNDGGNIGIQQQSTTIYIRKADCDESDSINFANQFKQRSISTLTNDYINNVERVDDGLLKSITFAVAMSFHSVLEGFALGVQTTQTGMMTLFISLIIHKGIEAFSVGLQITRSNAKRLIIVVLTIGIYAMMTPFGSIIGVLLTNLYMDEVLKDGIVFVLESLAGGTFIYVTFFEVLSQERANDFSNLVQLGAIVFGFLVISALQVNESLSEKYLEQSSTSSSITGL